MSESIQNLNSGNTRQSVKIEQTKYDVIRNAVIETLKRNGSMTFTELADLIEVELQGEVDGSVTWYFTTVKLDLEARGEIRRVPFSKPQKIELCMQ
jgi:hypothetical protein